MVGGRDAFFAFAGRKKRKQVMEMARSYQGRAQGSLAGGKYRNITPRTMDVETAMLYGQRLG